nr:tRNA (adenosine(37)-N6)-threonylcarbamoyltransferase complex dimerization subunit type 1 TsaB [Jannaschia sp. Os4]
MGFDTSAAHCAAALVSGDRVVVHRVEAMAKGQAERLMPLLEEVLAEGGAGWRDLSALGVGVGPGNFTGLRIAVAAARGLALGLGIPAEGVGAAEALGHGRGDVVAALSAPRGAVLAVRGGRIARVGPGDPLPEGWAGLPRLGPAAGLLDGRSSGPVVEAAAMAPSVARIAAARAAPGRPRPAPLYARPADAASGPAAPPLA